MVIRKAGAKDLDAVMRLERASPTAPHWGVKVWEELLGKRDEFWSARVVLVAVVDGAVVGFVVGQCVGFVAEMESVVVGDAARRGGVGRALVGALREWAVAQGAEVVELEVRESNDAVGFYTKLGFVEQGRRVRYYSDPVEDAVLMVLKQGNSE